MTCFFFFSFSVLILSSLSCLISMYACLTTVRITASKMRYTSILKSFFAWFSQEVYGFIFSVFFLFENVDKKCSNLVSY